LQVDFKLAFCNSQSVKVYVIKVTIVISMKGFLTYKVCVHDICHGSATIENNKDQSVLFCGDLLENTLYQQRWVNIFQARFTSILNLKVYDDFTWLDLSLLNKFVVSQVVKVKIPLDV